MERHYVAATQRAVAGLDDELAATIEELTAEMRSAPATIKPLYAVAIQNLKGLADTKASQQNLIVALRTIHEVTGMKQQQNLMLTFARQMFGTAPAPVAALPDGIELAIVVDDDTQGATSGSPAEAVLVEDEAQ
jgi:hypothetical protein